MRAIEPIEPIDPRAIEDARERLAGVAVRTPLVRLEAPKVPKAPVELYLKLECLQPIGSFKLRGAWNALALADPATLARDGTFTASAGNMAQGLAWSARRRGIACRVVVPEQAPATKLDAIAHLGAEAVKVPFDRWWRTMETHSFPGLSGHFVHPVSDPAVIAGNGTIGLEIVEDLPEVGAVLVPFGGGGLSCGIASALRARAPGVPVYACEVATAAPLAASLEAGAPRAIDHVPSFVDGIGGKSVLPEMWPLVRDLLAGALVVELEAVAAAVRLLATRAHVVAEGAGATPLAAALEGMLDHEDLRGPVVCVVSGGNIDASVLARILAGRPPRAS